MKPPRLQGSIIQALARGTSRRVQARRSKHGCVHAPSPTRREAEAEPCSSLSRFQNTPNSYPPTLVPLAHRASVTPRPARASPSPALPAIAPIITSGLIKSKRRPLVRPAQRYQIPIPLYRTTSTRPRTLGRENDGGGSEGAGRRGTRQCGGSKGEAKKRETGMEGSRRTRFEEP